MGGGRAKLGRDHWTTPNVHRAIPAAVRPTGESQVHTNVCRGEASTRGAANVGAGLWEDEPVREQLCEQVAREIGQTDGVLIVDASGFAKKEEKSVGVQRQ